MGSVYEAEQESPRRTVALKVIKPALVVEAFLRRFENESAALARLQHSSIAQIYEAGVAISGSGPQPYFAMEFVSGVSLRSYANASQLSTRARLELMAKVCDAVQHAHEHGIIHRDLKPANILVNEEGQPKVLDFGAAHIADRNFETTYQTEVGQLVGTIAYMSPEQVLADPAALDTRSDVYSLGVVLYEVLSGGLPYKTDKIPVHEAVRTILEQDPPSLGRVRRDFRGDVETIVSKALEKDKGRRYPSAAALATDIRRYLCDEPILARAPTTSYQLSKFARRHRPIVASIAATFAVLVLGFVVSTMEAVRASRAERLASERLLQAEQARELAQMRERDASRERSTAEHQSTLARTAQEEAEKRTVIAREQRNKAEAAANEASARQLAAESEYLRNTHGQLTLASLLAIEAVRRTPLLSTRGAVALALTLAGQPRLQLKQTDYFAVSQSARNISPDGTWLITSFHTMAHVWDVGSGREVIRLNHPAEVSGVAVSADGKWITTTSDSTVWVWDASTGRERTHIKDQGPIKAVAISPDGTWLATVNNSAVARIWDCESGRERARLEHEGSIEAVAASYDGTWLATASADHTARIWDAVNGRERVRLNHSGHVWDVVVSMDGKSLITLAVQDRQPYFPGWGDTSVWDAVTGHDRVHLGQSDSDRVGISSNGAWIATVTSSEHSPFHTIHTFDAGTGLERARFEYKDWIQSIAISPDGNWVTMGDATGAQIWDVSGAHERARLEGGWVGHVVISPDGKWLVTSPGLRIWDTSTGRARARLNHDGQVGVVAISSDGLWLATASRDSTSRIWDAMSGRERAYLQHHGPVTAVEYARGGTWLATASEDGTARIWDARTGLERVCFRHPSKVQSMSIGRDGRWLAAACGDTVHMWDPFTGRERGRLKHPSYVVAIAISPDGSRLASATLRDGVVRVWNTFAQQELAFLHHDDLIERLVMSNDGRLLATLTVNGIARVWDLSTGREVADMRDHAGRINDVAFSPDSKWLVTAGNDKSARIWQASDGHERATLEHQHEVKKVAISSDGKWIATISVDLFTADESTVHIWEAATGSEYLRLPFQKIETVAFIPRPQLLAVVQGSSVTIEPWRTEDLVHDLCARMIRNMTTPEWRQYLGNEPYAPTCPNIPPSQ
jgi:WD40 repeat protein